MIHSTITRMTGLGLLFSVITISGYVLIANESKNAATEQAVKTVSAQDTSETLMKTDEDSDMPVVKLASLSVLTDYPAVDESKISAQLDMSVEERLLNAKQLASVQKFEEALHMLETTPTSDHEEYSVNYLKAQILSWSGNHTKAEQAFMDLRRQHPQDADIALSFAYFHLYQDNFKEAERLFTQVLERFPDYEDAQLGLKRAMAIQ